jgi:hypothetical protein
MDEERNSVADSRDTNQQQQRLLLDRTVYMVACSCACMINFLSDLASFAPNRLCRIPLSAAWPPRLAGGIIRSTWDHSSLVRLLMLAN